MKKEVALQNRIAEFCRQKELLKRGDRILLGLSGGADSVCLFLVLSELAKSWELTLVPVHVNHNLRGGEAMQDQRFCEELCRRHQRELTVVSVPVAELAREHGWTLEEAGRNARYRAFGELAGQHQCNRIAVAHHKNDQAETVLFQLFRGSRVKGLSGMSAANGSIIRPLLCVTREEIEAYLQEKQQEYCIDHTNLCEEYTRNLIRHKILPLAEQLQPKAVEHVAETAGYLERVEDLLERQTRVLYQQAVIRKENAPQGQEVVLSIPVLKGAEPLLAERVLYQALCTAAGGKKDIASVFVTDCMALLKKQTGRRVNLPGGLLAKKQYEELWIGRELSYRMAAEDFSEQVVKDFPFTVFLPEIGKNMTLTLIDRGKNAEFSEENLRSIPKSTYTKSFNYDKIKEIVSVRLPAKEDTIALYTDGRGKKALDVLKEAKIPAEGRKRYPVLAAGTEVLWIPGIRGSEAFRVTEETKYVLNATIDGGNENGG